jgi:predicted nucleic acid-binding protein
VIFVDASVLLAAEDLDDGNHRAASELLKTGALGTIELAAYEVANVAILRWKDRAAAGRLIERVWAIAELGTFVRVDQDLSEQIIEVCGRHGLSAYDAAYVAGAHRVGAPLASCDERDLVSRGLARLPRDLL